MDQNESKKINWMYEGKKSSIDHEQYLLGRRITSVGDDDDEKGDFLVKPESSIGTGNVTVLERLDYESKVREDPLFHIRKNDYQHRKELLSNPLKKKRIQNMLKQALEKDLSRKDVRNDSSDSSSSDSDSSSSSDNDRMQQHRSKKHRTNDRRNDSSKDKRKFSNSLTTSKKAEPLPERSKLEKHVRKHSEQSTEHRVSATKHSDEYHERKRHSETENLRKSGYGLMCVQDGKHISSSVKKRKRRERSPSPEKPKPTYHRKNKSGFSRGLTKEELDRKRMEMMNNASWRDDQRKGNVKKFKMEDAREDEEEKRKQMKRSKDKYGHSRDFLHDMKLKSASSGSIEDSVRRKKHTLSRKF